MPDYILHDITMPMDEGMVCYPKDVPYQPKFQRSLKDGDSSNVTELEMSAHTGTHVDSPMHYMADGYGCSEIPLDHLYGPAYVIDCRGSKEVTGAMIREKTPRGVHRLLLKTDNSKRLDDNVKAPFTREFVYLSGCGAEACVELGIRLIGIDYLSIDQSGVAEKPAHHVLLEKNITILEGIMLEKIAPGDYFLACGSLKMVGADGAPARVILIENFI